MANMKRVGASALILAWLASPAFALNARTWVSGTGVDQASCGTIAVHVGRSTIMGNNYGTYCINPADAFSFGNNQVVGNNLNHACSFGPVALK